MNPTKPQLIIFGGVALIVIVIILLFLGVIPGLKSKNKTATITGTVKIWGVFDHASDYAAAFNNLKTIYPDLNFDYQSFDNAKDYETALLNALAAGQGPDIFMIHNNDLADQIDKIVPVPQTAFTTVDLQNLFPQVVSQDFVSQGRIYALPLSIDTLAMIYNRDIFDQAAIATPPRTWENLIQTIPGIIKTDNAGRITRAAAGIGGAENIDNASDLLNLLMLQTGTQMVSPDMSQATFASTAGLNALNFYAQFAKVGNNAYTWNSSLPNTLDMFSQGNLAMIFDYDSAIAAVKARNAFINFGVAPMPQPQNAQISITYPNYWGFAVSRQSHSPAIAWNIVLALTTNPKNAQSYLAANQKPPALRSLINDYANDPILNVFAKQILIARDWPEVSPDTISQIFNQLIDSVLNNADPQSALKQAQDQITQILTNKL